MSVDQIHMTKQGYDKLKDELHTLKVVERPKIIDEIAQARAHGDLRENAEYHAAREKQGFIEGRITLLEDHLARAAIVDFSGHQSRDVKFGSYVTVEDLDSGEERTYRIVGDIEADISQNLISINSPIGKALLGKKIGDFIEIEVPKGVLEYDIKVIRY
ncbi:MAG: transcription elongation factor GreA [Oligoflexales bacterium]